ncbi:hypothetical protein [Pedobacter sp. KLB.chiD]
MKTTKKIIKKTLFVFKDANKNAPLDDTGNFLRTITTISIRPTTL